MTNNEKKSDAEIAFRKAILNAKAAKVSGKCYCVSKISDLNLASDNAIWEKEGQIDFQATAEVFFKSKTSEGDYFSTGDRPKISGTIEKKGQEYTLVSPIIVEGNVNTRDLKIYENE